MKKRNNNIQNILTKEFLVDCINKNLKSKDICSLVDCCESTLGLHLQKFGLTLKNKPKDNLKDRTFNRWTVIEKMKRGWLCECSCELKTRKVQSRYDLEKGNSKSCGCYNKEQAWKGYGEISGTYWSRLEQAALKRNIKFEITIEYAWELFLKQDRKCALTGDLLLFSRSYFNYNQKDRIRQTASLDRKDSTKDYTMDNIWWTDVDINYAKSNYSVEEFIEICRKVTEYNAVRQIGKEGINSST